MFSPRHAVYMLHGTMVWSVIGVLTFPLFVSDVWNVLLHPTRAVFVYAALTIASGQILGSAIYAGLRLAELASPRPVVHVIVPLVAAALAGCAHAAIACSGTFPAPDGSVLQFRSPTFTLIAAIVLALLATPIIIFRSARLSERLGLSGQPRVAADPRWGGMA